MSETVSVVLAGTPTPVNLYDSNTLEAARQAGLSAASADVADLARDAALAASNFIDGGIAAGEAATTAGQFFTVESPDGVLSYRVRTGGGSTEIASTPTTASVAAQFAPYIMRNINTVYVCDYGANPNGTGESSVAIKAASDAIGAGGRIVCPPGIYQCDDETIPIKDFQTWENQGATFRTANDAKPIFLANQVADWSMIGATKLIGSMTAYGQAVDNGEAGLHIVDAERFFVDNVRASSFKGAGIWVATSGFGETLRGDEGHLSNIAARLCNKGIQVDVGAGGEYNSWTSIQVSGCLMGLDLAAGNNRFSSGNLVDNQTNLRLRGGANNHGHGEIVGFGINHAGIPGGPSALYNVHATDVGNGFTFTGNDFYEHPIYLVNSRGIVFTAGIIDCPFYNDIGAGTYAGVNAVRNMFVPTGGTGFTVQTNDAGLPNVIVQNVTNGSGWHPLCDPSPVMVQATRTTTEQNVASGQKLVFNSESRDNRNAYNTTTGVFTAPVAGVYEIGLCISIAGTALTGGYLLLLKNAGHIGTIAVTAVTATLAATTALVRVPMAAGDTLELESGITGATALMDTTISSLSISLMG